MLEDYFDEEFSSPKVLEKSLKGSDNDVIETDMNEEENWFDELITTNPYDLAASELQVLMNHDVIDMSV